MRKYFCLAISMSLILLAMFFAGCASGEPEKIYVDIISLGDSISAGYAPSGSDMYDCYMDYVTKRVPANKKSFTYLMGENISSDYVYTTTKSYAQSGDKTGDLVEKFNQSAILNSLKRADIITLCIGANNVLSVATDNLTDYLFGYISDDEISQLLNRGVEDFKNDYTNKIIPVLTYGDAKIFVMTIYDPYKYFDISTSNIALSQSAMENFENLKTIVIEYLNQINDYIRSEKFDNVYVVDVNSAFESLNEEEYANYLNISSQSFDPHPTSNGQRYIAELFTNKLQEIAGISEEN